MFKVISCANKLHVYVHVSTGCFVHVGFVYFVGTVAAFGCKAFALLFYDIDRELSTSDKGDFQSSACAEVSVTNEMFEHLGQPEFYFCPTGTC